MADFHMDSQMKRIRRLGGSPSWERHLALMRRVEDAEALLRVMPGYGLSAYDKERWEKARNAFLAPDSAPAVTGGGWLTREQAEKRAAELMEIGRTTLRDAAKAKHAVNCAYWDGIMEQRCTCGLEDITKDVCNHFPGQKTCAWCHGTGAIDAPTSADDPSCPECDGEGVRQ